MVSKRKRSRAATKAADDAAKEIGQRMKDIRTESHYSREDAANALGWSELRVWRLESGVTRQRAEDLQAYAAWLRVPVGRFYGRVAA